MSKVRELYLDPVLTDDETAKLSGELLGETSYKVLIEQDTDVYCKETNNCIAKFRKEAIPANIAISAYKSLKKAATPTANRAKASSKKGEFRIKKDGKLSNTHAAKTIKSGIIGYFDRTVRTPYCRQTAFNQKEFEKFKQAYGIIKFVDNKYKELMPEHYELQRNVADETSKDFIIPDTSFTTVTVNSNWQTAIHTDKGDFERGFGNLTVLRKGRYEGGYFVVPKWGLAFDMQNCDLLLVDVHQWHGNTPIKKIDEKAHRLSLVMYYREKMFKCGSAEEEQKIAKHRPIRQGADLY